MVITWLSLGRVKELSELIKNILFFILKMNRGLMGLERHEGGVINDIIILGSELSLEEKKVKQSLDLSNKKNDT